jgi:hypothetical protein
MTTLLVLGSKPESILPGSVADEVACAIASGRSARSQGCRSRGSRVVSAIVTSGRKPANDLAVEALRGLQTGRLIIYPYFLPRYARNNVFRGLRRKDLYK